MTESRLNKKVLAELRAVMEDEFPMLLETFFADTEQRLQSISAALQQGNASDFSRACHSLKGSASNLGLDSLTRVCREGEQIGREGSLTGCEELYKTIKTEVSELMPLLRAEIE